MIKWNMKKMYDYCKDNNLDLPKEGQEYTNLHNKYIYICPNHGEYLQRWSEHKNGHGCRKCQYTTINKKDDSYFIDKLKAKFKGSVKINRIYRKDKKVYGNFTCNKHNYIYDRLVNRMLDKRRGNLCPMCAKENKIKNRTGKTSLKTPEQYLKECKAKGYDLPIEDYINNKTKINHKCPKGHIYPQKPDNHLQGQGCPTCKKKTPNEYLQECKEKGLDLPIEDYKGANIKINHKCKKGHIYPQKPSMHITPNRLNGCPKCNVARRRKTPAGYIQECKDKGLDLPVEGYIDNLTKINHICSKGHIYEQKPSSHLQGIGCPVCSESHGEKYIRNYLDKNNIKYESQKKFKDLKDKTYLSYDFYLPDYNMLIEYQGQQHYEPIKFNGKNNSNFKNQQYHDKMKKEYAKDSGYKLLELKYTLNTQELVDKYLERRIK